MIFVLSQAGGGGGERPPLHVSPLTGQTLQQGGSRWSESSFPLAVFLVLGPGAQEIAAKYSFLLREARAEPLQPLPVLEAVAGLGVLQLGVLVVPEGGPVRCLLSLESVDPPVERTVGQVIVYSSLQ